MDEPASAPEEQVPEEHQTVHGGMIPAGLNTEGAKGSLLSRMGIMRLRGARSRGYDGIVIRRPIDEIT